MSAEIFDPKKYLSEAIEREKRLLKNANRVTDGQCYVTDRNIIADFAQDPLADKIIEAKEKGTTAVKVLEIGGGQGRGILELSIRVSSPRVKYFMTSLIGLPEHEVLTTHGIEVFTGLLAESLPEGWSDTFDMVLTSVMLGWTQLDRSIPEIKRILSPNGIWIGIEQTGVDSQDREHLQQDIERHMADNNMRNSAQYPSLTRAISKLAHFEYIKDDF